MGRVRFRCPGRLGPRFIIDLLIRSGAEQNLDEALDDKELMNDVLLILWNSKSCRPSSRNFMGFLVSYIVPHVVPLTGCAAIYRQRTSRQRLIMVVSKLPVVRVSKEPGWKNVVRSSSPPLPLVWVSIRIMYAMSSMLVHRIV